jgi:hypothetical protein
MDDGRSRNAAPEGSREGRPLRRRPTGGWRAVTVLAAAVALGGGALSACGSSSSSSSSTAATASNGAVLLVGTFDGHAGGYKTIQSAVDAAKSGDWILVAPGDYHEDADGSGVPTDPAHGDMGGVMITTSGLHLRGMDRSTVIVDGTKSGSSGSCSADPGAQDYGAMGSNGQTVGRNGILVWKADDVSVQNLTACNFLAGTGDSGNEIWWNGGADSGKIGLKGYSGSYLTATSTFFSSQGTADQQEASAAQYGIFSSNAQGPGSWNQLYASNFNDSGMYVGACHQLCDVTVDHAWMEFNALGYSGTNSGGAVVVENSQFDNNQDGLDTNTQINGDPPAPQNGACPNGAVSPITHTHSCWVAIHDNFHDNNNPNVPEAGNAAAGPTGTGMTLSGGRNDTVMDDTFSNNGAWGFLMVPYPDSGTPSLHQSCSRTGGVETAGFGCVYDPMGDALVGNTFNHNGYFGNPGNSDYGQIVLDAGQPQNCFSGNTAPNGSTPSDLEQTQPTCGKITTASNTGGPLLDQVLCDTGFGTCPAGASYPARTGVVMHPLPAGLPTMPDPCSGVPANAWCRGGKPV